MKTSGFELVFNFFVGTGDGVNLGGLPRFFGVGAIAGEEVGELATLGGLPRFFGVGVAVVVGEGVANFGGRPRFFWWIGG